MNAYLFATDYFTTRSSKCASICEDSSQNSVRWARVNVKASKGAREPRGKEMKYGEEGTIQKRADDKGETSKGAKEQTSKGVKVHRKGANVPKRKRAKEQNNKRADEQMSRRA